MVIIALKDGDNSNGDHCDDDDDKDVGHMMAGQLQQAAIPSPQADPPQAGGQLHQPGGRQLPRRLLGRAGQAPIPSRVEEPG